MPAEQLITIFEGPDGSGKSTAAKDYAVRTNAHYVHMGPLKHVTSGLARMYVEAMMPALLGHRSVVMDRCWLSEPIYGRAFRGGKDRLHKADYRMLERLAMRCGAVVVHCRPSMARVVINWSNRRAGEMLKARDQLVHVYELYGEQVPLTSLPVELFDYTKGNFNDVQSTRMPSHPLESRSAGNYHADVIIVGEKFAEPKNQDPLYQWPFASFSDDGCSRWLTDLLTLAGVGEQDLLWFNADQLSKPMVKRWVGRKVFALGAEAVTTLHEMLGPDDGVMLSAVEHPQYWRRFRSLQPYPLVPLLKQALEDTGHGLVTPN